jgi:calcineurin-like phosphoesterase family protein
MNDNLNKLSKITPECKADMETFHFTADLHHSHPKIVEICNRPIFIPYYNGEKSMKNPDYKQKIDIIHNEWLTNEVINKWVDKKHTLFIIGDVTMDKREKAEKFIDKLNGNKFLILGNHDKNIHNSTRFNQITQIKDFTYSNFGLNIHIVCCHYHMLSWNRKIHGSWHLFGHVHGRLNQDIGLAFDVGIDNPELHKITGGIYRPLNLYEIVKIMDEKQNKKSYIENIEVVE